jgi:hypothetical protein
MKNIKNLAAQGDMILRRVEEVPAAFNTERPSEGGKHVLAHSETGHNHWVGAEDTSVFEDPANSLVCYLRVEGEYADIVHARSFDTHETIRLERGTWEVRRQREYTPEGWRRVED